MKEKFQFNWPIPDQSLSTNGVEVNLSGIQMDVATQLEKPTLVDDNTQLDVRSKDLSVRIRISRIFVDQIVERNVGGIIGRFRLKADCSNVEFNLIPGKGSFSLRVSPEVGSSLQGATVTDAKLDWGADSLTSSDITCTGVEGFEDLISAEVKRVAANSDTFFAPQKPQLISYLNGTLSSYNFDIGEKRQLMISRPDIQVWMRVDDFKDQGADGAKVKGLLFVEFAKGTTKEAQVLRLEDVDLSGVNTALLRLPPDFMKVMVKEGFAANTWVEKVMSNKLPGFSTLMSSRFSQFFVWPELMRYSRSAQFLFEIYSNKDIEVSGGKDLVYGLNSTLLSRMNAPRGGKQVPFMNFVVPFKSQVKLSVKSGVVNARLTSPQMSLQYSWDRDYLNRYGKYREFSSSTIRSRILSALGGQNLTMKLPVIPLLEGLNLQVKSLEAPAQGKSVRVILGVNP